MEEGELMKYRCLVLDHHDSNDGEKLKRRTIREILIIDNVKKMMRRKE